ncbi:MAG: hypothetical protein JOS17DRAFT_688121 [Linnemannia elongata]|nr:MAG: hypothetical protein JOS17DRAFT_688121 [Linnemannia elongata]
MPPRFVAPAAPKCPRCTKSVYSAEQIIGPNGAAWHKACFTCRECNRRLDSNILAEHEGEAYCKTCHKKMWGPTGYGYASGLLALNFQTGAPAPVSSGPPSLPKRALEPVVEPVRELTPTQQYQDEQPAFTTTPKTSYYRSGGLMTPKKMTTSFGGGGDICPRCQKTVYHAESALAPGGAKYHKLCLRCVECSKSLDSTNMTDRQGTPYCKACYSKAWGAKGYGYGSGASMLHTEL